MPLPTRTARWLYISAKAICYMSDWIQSSDADHEDRCDRYALRQQKEIGDSTALAQVEPSVVSPLVTNDTSYWANVAECDR